MTIEEHGGGKQLIRFRCWPRFQMKALAIGLLIALLSVAAAFDGAAIATVLLALASAVVVLRLAQECAVSMGTIVNTLDDRAGARRYLMNVLGRSEVRET
jgi:hypothetical protein